LIIFVKVDVDVDVGTELLICIRVKVIDRRFVFVDSIMSSTLVLVTKLG